ncbi:MAG: universal stress protein, partial [Myxococcales bacterium]
MPIVCATDLSQPARAGVEAAAAVARVLRDALYLVHVVASDDYGDTATLMARRANAEAALGRLTTALPGVQVRPFVVAGSAHQAITQFAEQSKASLIMLASSGHATSSLFRVGGSSERIVYSSSLPVLVVRDAAPFLAWADGKRPLRVLLAVGETPEAEGLVQWTRQLRAAAPCDVTVANVYYASDAWQRFGVPATGAQLQPDAQLEALVGRELRQRVGDLGGAGEVRWRPIQGLGRAADYLLNEAELMKADLVVMGAHRARGPARLWSTTAALLHYGTGSVLCVPQAESAPVPRRVPPVRSVLVATDFDAAAGRAVGAGLSLVENRSDAKL